MGKVKVGAHDRKKKTIIRKRRWVHPYSRKIGKKTVHVKGHYRAKQGHTKTHKRRKPKKSKKKK